MVNTLKRSRRRGRDAVTMHEVARHVGVSPMTVSRVLRGVPKVRDATRQRVQLAIKQLGYSPNTAARNLASAMSEHIGLLYNNPSAAFLDEVLVGVLEYSSQAGSQIVVEKCGARGERSTVERMAREGVGGVILTPPMSDSKGVWEALRAAKLPFVAVASGLPVVGGVSVRINDFEAAAAMTEYLVGLGHRRIGFIAGPPKHAASSQRYGGYVAALHEAGQLVSTELVEQGEYSYRSGLEAAQKLLGLAQRPTAIFASNDDMAAAAIAMAHRNRLDVPKEISIVGFDDTRLATTIWPALTTVRQPVAAMARQAAELLLEEIRLRRFGQTLEPLEQFVKFSLIKRESSAPP